MYIRPVKMYQATDLVADIYAQITRDDLLSPPSMLHSPVPELLGGRWLVWLMMKNRPAGAVDRYQVDAGVIRAFRAEYPGDDQLIQATAWASFTAARRIESWL